MIYLLRKVSQEKKNINNSLKICSVVKMIIKIDYIFI